MGSAYRSPENAQTLFRPTLFLGNFTSSFPQSIFVYVLENSEGVETIPSQFLVFFFQAIRGAMAPVAPGPGYAPG